MGLVYQKRAETQKVGNPIYSGRVVNSSDDSIDPRFAVNEYEGLSRPPVMQDPASSFAEETALPSIPLKGSFITCKGRKEPGTHAEYRMSLWRG